MKRELTEEEFKTLHDIKSMAGYLFDLVLNCKNMSTSHKAVANIRLTEFVMWSEKGIEHGNETTN